ncbi:hypothetical protein D0T12_10755 [Actinomadura spongiicola]|uniref:Type VII secretion system protein EssD-like domain-containing protein n=1 Tax=Actinomadura spongiicola TaxID=2303421 RepID=A0A372GKA0_9ACTN|nr:DNA/RNA non-specific endonuclease [Actinomadura spongiicola]RFS85503.1 hypothetical protein D0T12_10755 [Actinomadura spongiicola]
MIVPDEVLGIMAKVHPDAVEAEAHDLRKAATGIREAGSDVHTTWQGLSAFYKAPEAAQLFSATTPVRDESAMFAGRLEKVTGALTTYAAETRVIKHKLMDLYMRAVTFVNKTYAEKEDWQKNEDLVRENNALLAAVDAQAMAFHNAQERATHTIYAAYGETAPALPTGGGDSERPWGTPEEADLPWYHDAWNGGVSLVKGFFGDGFWGDVSGIWDLVTSPGKWVESYKSLMALTLPLNPIVAPFAMLVPSVRRKVHETWKGFGKSFVAWDRWKQDPARAFGNTAYNVVTSIIPIGKAGSAGKLGKFSHGASRVGEVVDPVGLTVRASITLPKVADITAALSGKIADLTTATKLNVHRFVIKPAIDLKAYALSKTANIPDRIPDWLLRQHGAEAAAQVRAAHNPDLVGARTGPSANLQDSPTPTREAGTNTAPTSESPAVAHRTSGSGTSGSTVSGDMLVDGPPPSTGSPHPPGGGTPAHGAPPDGGTPELQERTIEANDRLAPRKTKPFGINEKLEGDTKYIVTDRAGRERGIFITDKDGKITEIHTKSGEKRKWNPDLRNPLPNATYHIDNNWVFRTDDQARTVSVEGDLHYPGSEDARRMASDQRNAGYEGSDEYRRLNKQITDNFEAEHGRPPLEHEVKLYHRVNWNGGHLIGTAFGGPGERINLVGMLEKLNQAQKGTTPLNNYRKLESYFIALLDGTKPPRIRIAIEVDYLANSRVPTGIAVIHKVGNLPLRRIAYDNMPSFE